MPRKNKKKKRSENKNNNNNKQHNQNPKRILNRVLIIEVLLFSLYVSFFIFGSANIPNIPKMSTIGGAIGIVAGFFSIIGGKCNLIGISAYIKRKSRSNLKARWLVEHKHYVIISVLILMNVWMISSTVTSYSIAADGNENDAKPIQIVVSPEPAIDSSEGAYPDSGPSSILSCDNSHSIVPSDSIRSLYGNVLEEEYIVQVSSLIGMELLTKENKDFLSDKIKICLQKKCSTGYQPTNEEVNGNAEFTKYTSEADTLSRSLDEMIMDEETLLETIDLRLNAYKIFQTKSLRRLLANNYERLGLFYYKTNRSANDTFNAFMKSIKYRSEYLCMLSTDDQDYYWEIYRIGRSFSTIACINDLDNNYKLHASLIACCILELSSSNADALDREKTLFFSSYYAGMENHRLLLTLPTIDSRPDKDINGICIIDALKFYERSFEAREYTLQRFYQHKYVTQVADLALKYINRFGNSNGYINKDELNEIKNRCAEFQ